MGALFDTYTKHAKHAEHAKRTLVSSPALPRCITSDTMPVVHVLVSADEDTPNMLLHIWINDCKTVGELMDRVNTAIIEWDDWEGDASLCLGLAPVWGDGWDCYDPDDMIWEVD